MVRCPSCPSIISGLPNFISFFLVPYEKWQWLVFGFWSHQSWIRLNPSPASLLDPIKTHSLNIFLISMMKFLGFGAIQVEWKLFYFLYNNFKIFRKWIQLMVCDSLSGCAWSFPRHHDWSSCLLFKRFSVQVCHELHKKTEELITIMLCTNLYFTVVQINLNRQDSKDDSNLISLYWKLQSFGLKMKTFVNFFVFTGVLLSCRF